MPPMIILPVVCYAPDGSVILETEVYMNCKIIKSRGCCSQRIICKIFADDTKPVTTAFFILQRTTEIRNDGLAGNCSGFIGSKEQNNVCHVFRHTDGNAQVGMFTHGTEHIRV